MKQEAFDQMLAKASKTVQKLNADLARVCPRPGEAGYPRKGKRIRQSHKPLLNKLEREFQEWFTRLVPIESNHFFMAQAMRFRLANGVWFKPDFVFIRPLSPLRIFEIKGPHAFRGGLENLKVAAHQYPMFEWTLVWREKGEWKFQQVLP